MHRALALLAGWRGRVCGARRHACEGCGPRHLSPGRKVSSAQWMNSLERRGAPLGRRATTKPLPRIILGPQYVFTLCRMVKATPCTGGSAAQPDQAPPSCCAPQRQHSIGTWAHSRREEEPQMTREPRRFW